VKHTYRSCKHCRAALPAGDEADAFCCTGCAGAYALLSNAGLTRYYELQEGFGTPGDAAPRDFPWLPAMLDLARHEGQSDARLTLTLDAQGLHCAGCVWVIQTLFSRQPGAHHIGINPGVGRLTLTIDATTFPLEPFLTDLARLGYRTGPPMRDTTSISDGLGIRLGTVFAIAMNSMALSLSGYFGLSPGDPDGIYALFGWVNLGLSTLALLIGGPVFIRGAVHALRRRTLHLDVPIALGIVLAYSGSAFLFVSGNPEAAYFDTLNIFIALMLLGRWAQRRILERNRRLLLSDDGMSHARVRIVSEDARIELTPLRSLAPGMRVMITPGELLPVAATLSADTAEAEFSLAWLTGESDPIAFDRNRPVPAGAHLVGRSAVTLDVHESFSASNLERLLAPQSDAAESPTDRFWHHLTTIYVLTVLIFAGLAFAVWFDAGLIRALGVTTAVLVITCPCALGLATPLAYELAQHRLRSLGLHARRQGLLDAARRVRHVVFDKTGTLTFGQLELVDSGALATLTPAQREILGQLTARSNHPKSRAIFEKLTRGEDIRVAPDAVVIETPGHGLQLGRWSLVRNGETLSLLEGQETVKSFEFKEVLRSDARDEIARICALGVDVHVASGDNPQRAATIGAALGLAPQYILAGLSPQAKADLIKRLGPDQTLMIGDGINDTLAFDAALLAGTPALDRAALPSRSDFYLATSGIGPISALLVEAARVRRQTRINIAFAIIYNVAGLTAALAGVLSPLVCAVAMPLSSLVVIAITASTSGIVRARRETRACPIPPNGLAVHA